MLKLLRKLLLVLLIPFFLLMTSTRLLFTPFYPSFEYAMPGFPVDSYGFSTSERLHWADISINYILDKNSPDDTLAKLRFEDGSPLFNEREISHMADVKVVYQHMITAWLILFTVFMALFLWAWFGNWFADYGHALLIGGWATIGFLILIVVLAVTSFYELFTLFHRLFFTGQSWVFQFSDTLIRLFPLRFWQDAFLYAGALTIGGALILIWAGRRIVKHTT